MLHIGLATVRTALKFSKSYTKYEIKNLNYCLKSLLKSDSVTFSNNIRLYCNEIKYTVAPKDKLLFRNTNQRFFNILSIFGITQFVFWNCLAQLAYTTLRDVDTKVNRYEGENTKISWWKEVNFGQYKTAFAIFCLIMGK